jgi:hypothetical protein
MSFDVGPRSRRKRRLVADRLEHQLVDVVMERLRPALEEAFRDLQGHVEELVGLAVGRELAQTSRVRRVGELKRCRVCGLEGARNFAGLRRHHTREEHTRARSAKAAAAGRATPSDPPGVLGV